MKVAIPVTALVLAVTAASAAQAQNYPTKPIRFIVPTSASGTIDISARMIAKPLEAILGQPVLVDNRPGATYTMATDLCAHAAPDGHTFC